ncbi:MAG: hypothetical protein KF755_01700 [Burkholderiaceae bacterium]|nr:hypothetical protein [Burkholderiaceae bacterium]
MFLKKLITRPWRALLPLVASCLVATACSSTKLGYDAMPMWLGWQLDRYLALDATQREMASARIEALHRWHRQTQLPAYTAFLGAVQARLDGPIGPEDIGRWREEALTAWTPLAERMAPDVAALALTLRPAQLERMARRFEESNRDERRKLLPETPERREAARAERVLERVRFFVGDLPSRQEREIRAAAAALPPSEGDWLAEREARQKAVLDVLARIVRERPTQEVAQQWVRETLTGLWRSADPTRREAIARSTAAGDALSAAILARPEQRRQLHQRLRDFADDFSVLAAR